MRCTNTKLAHEGNPESRQFICCVCVWHATQCFKALNKNSRRNFIQFFCFDRFDQLVSFLMEFYIFFELNSQQFPLFFSQIENYITFDCTIVIFVQFQYVHHSIPLSLCLECLHAKSRSKLDFLILFFRIVHTSYIHITLSNHFVAFSKVPNTIFFRIRQQKCTRRKITSQF